MMLSQAMYLFGIHLMAVQYPKRIHRSSKMLIALFVKFRFVAHQLKDHLRLSQSIQMLHVANQYGITYGSAQLVTMATFAKVP